MLLSSVMGTRVLKAHVEAVLDCLETAMAAKRVGGKRAFAEVVAQAVLTATDGKKQCVVVINEGRGLMVFGPYASSGAARRAMERGLATRGGAVGSVFPLIPGPKMDISKARLYALEETDV